MWKVWGLCLSIFMAASAAAQEPATAINWQSWESAVQQQEESDLPILLFVYTDWCALCKRTNEQCWADPGLARFINTHFLPVRINAASTDPIAYQGQTYHFVRKQSLGYHAFIAHLMKGQLSFPGLIFLGPGQELLQTFTGFQAPPQMERLLTYFGQGHYRQVPWTTFERQYQLQIITEED